MQRFGTYSVRTHELGKEILRQNWRKVAELILSQHADFDATSKIRKDKMVELVFGPSEGAGTRENIECAIDILDRRDRLEKTVLFSLRTSPNDYYNAFTAISRGTRFIYIHAYQSYVWNRAVSERLRRFGKKVLVGDLVAKADLLEEDVDLVELNATNEDAADEAKPDPKEEAKESGDAN